jgi:hypothetical protein
LGFLFFNPISFEIVKIHQNLFGCKRRIKFNVNTARVCGWASLKDLTAFRIAKYAPMPYIKGGSPTAFELKIAIFPRSVSSGMISISFGTE